MGNTSRIMHFLNAFAKSHYYLFHSCLATSAMLAPFDFRRNFILYKSSTDFDSVLRADIRANLLIKDALWTSNHMSKACSWALEFIMSSSAFICGPQRLNSRTARATDRHSVCSWCRSSVTRSMADSNRGGNFCSMHVNDRIISCMMRLAFPQMLSSGDPFSCAFNFGQMLMNFPDMPMAETMFISCSPMFDSEYPRSNANKNARKHCTSTKTKCW